MAFTIDPNLLGLEGAVAYVTGAAQGIGRGCALQLARAGCHVVVVDANREKAMAAVDAVEALGRRSLHVAADVRSAEGMQEVIERTRSVLGPVDVACHVVGNPAHAPKPLLDTTLAEWDATLAQNLTSAFVGTRAAALAMIEDRVPGRIINLASSSGVVGAPNVADYGAAKAGVIHLTKSAAMELDRFGIRVNCIVPGTHTRPDDERTVEATPAMLRFRARAAAAPPLGRLGDPEETGGLAVFLASKLSSYMMGHAVFSDGGVVHTTARPPVGLDIVPAALAHLDWVRAAYATDASGS